MMTAACAAAELKPVALLTEETIDDWEAVDAGGSGETEWLPDSNVFVIHMGEMLSGAVYQKAADLPLTHYEVTLEAKRMRGVDFFCGLTFPVGNLETCATLVLGGWGGSVTGLSCIDGLDAANNATGTFQRYEDDVWYAVKLRVTPENISMWLGEKKLIDQDIAGRKVGIREGGMESYVPFSLTTYNTTGAFRNLVVTPLPEKKAE